MPEPMTVTSFQGDLCFLLLMQTCGGHGCEHSEVTNPVGALLCLSFFCSMYSPDLPSRSRLLPCVRHVLHESFRGTSSCLKEARASMLRGLGDGKSPAPQA